MAERTASVSEGERSAHELRLILREVFQEARAQSTIQQAFAHHVEYKDGTLRVCGDLFPLVSYDRVSVIAIGKGAHSMALALAVIIWLMHRGNIARLVTGKEPRIGRKPSTQN